MSLKNKASKGFFWSLVDNLSNQVTQFVIGVILARLLSPSEFGLVGMISVFLAISAVFVYSGFGEALIRKVIVKKEDYSTVFVFNLFVSILFYIILFISSGFIAKFYHEPILIEIVRIIGLVLIFDAIGIVPRTILTKKVDFKSQAKVAIVASIISGIIGISLAFYGFGIWSLVVKSLVNNLLRSILLWFYSKWKISFYFNKNAFKEMFRFSSRLLISGIINQTFNNLYFLIIGKYFSAIQLGFYTRANQFQTLFSTQLDTVVQRVSYPILSEIQFDRARLKNAYRRLIKSSMLISFILGFGMAAVSKNMILVLIGEKWMQSIEYLQLMCFVGMLYPLHSLNLNILNVKGRSDLFLKLEYLKKGLAIPVIVIGVLYGIKILIIGMILNSLIAFFINSYWSGKLISYSTKSQIKDLLPEFSISLLMSVFVLIIGYFSPFNNLITLIIQIILGGSFIILIGNIFRMMSYFELKNVLINGLNIKRLTS